MNRKEFMSDMIKNILNRKTIGIPFPENNNGTIEFNFEGTLLRDCTYSQNYKTHIINTICPLFNEKMKKIKRNKGEQVVHEDITEYRERAKTFIFSLIKCNDKDIKITEKLHNATTLSMLEYIYRNIIIDEIFNVQVGKESKKLGEDDFEESKCKIQKKIESYLISEDLNIIKQVKRNVFFESLVKSNPDLDGVDFDYDNITVQEDFESANNLLKNILGNAYSPMEIIDLIKELKDDNGHFSGFGDIENMTEDNFFQLQLILDDLCCNSQLYYHLSLEDIILFKNTAIRIYNKLYGKERKEKEYEGRLGRQVWNTHERFAEYLMTLSWAIQDKREENKK